MNGLKLNNRHDGKKKQKKKVQSSFSGVSAFERHLSGAHHWKCEPRVEVENKDRSVCLSNVKTSWGISRG